jgi:hypothetical protein
MLVLSKALILAKILVTGLRDGKRASTRLLNDSIIVSGEVKVFSVFDPSVSAMKWKKTRRLVEEAIEILEITAHSASRPHNSPPCKFVIEKISRNSDGY